VGLRETQERILKPMMRRFGESLKGIERATSRGPIRHALQFDGCERLEPVEDALAKRL
jgi:hypothetical protein